MFLELYNTVALTGLVNGTVDAEPPLSNSKGGM